MGYIAFREIFLFLNVYLDYYMVSGNYCLSLKRVRETVFMLPARQFRGLLASP